MPEISGGLILVILLILWAEFGNGWTDAPNAIATVIASGTIIGRWRIIRTMGFKLTKLEPVQRFAAETGAAATIELASRLGIPLSTTHTINTAIMGVGATRRFSAVRCGVTARIVGGWILTFPCCAAIAFNTTKIIMWFE
jgi:PiT family inorganic phosphate transporter